MAVIATLMIVLQVNCLPTTLSDVCAALMQRHLVRQVAVERLLLHEVAGGDRASAALRVDEPITPDGITRILRFVHRLASPTS